MSAEASLCGSSRSDGKTDPHQRLAQIINTLSRQKKKGPEGPFSASSPTGTRGRGLRLFAHVDPPAAGIRAAKPRRLPLPRGDFSHDITGLFRGGRARFFEYPSERVLSGPDRV